MFRSLKELIPRPVVNYSKHLPASVAANIKYGFPGKKLKVIGVTGTDGKTTTVNMIYRILKEAGKKVSMISTINAVIAGKVHDTGFHVTSPNPYDLQRYLKMAVDHGDEFMVLEVTSHGLDQFRVWGVPFEIVVLTNITHEHLDYHKTFGHYLNTKLKIIKSAKKAVINIDDPYLMRSSKLMAQDKLITFGLSQDAQFNLQSFSLKLNLPGNFNLYNALASAAVAVTLKIDKQTIKESLARIRGLNGRMEEVPNSKGMKIVIDFAHTPNALENALKTLRKSTKGRVISVFGCASQRDDTKRPKMGAISSNLADITVLTDEDPRYEDSHKIINEIVEGGQFKKGTNLYVESNRQKAINLALQIAGVKDTVGIFGKGHEKSMNYRGRELPWSDKSAVLKALRGHGR